jgi:EmrB/QacA subfamily drug resistance transporter
LVEIEDKLMFQSSLPRQKVYTAFAGAMLVMFLGSLYMTVTATAMPRIITDLGGFSQYTWVFTSYIITETIAVPLAGKLSDIYGRKWLYIIGITVFIIASFLSGISQTMMQLIIFRGLQGLGFGIIMALGFIVIADLFPPEERGKYGGLMAGVMAISTIIGPSVGGYLTDYLSWRWCFFITIPIGAVALILFIFFFPQFRTSHTKRKVDYYGTLAMILAITSLMLALSWGGVDYDWNSPTILGLFGFLVAMFVLLIVIESRVEEPIIPLELFKNRVVVVSSIASLLMGATFYPVVTFVPLYFQGVLGASASLSGNFLTPMMLSTAAGSFIAGQILSRTAGYYRLQGAIGFIMMAVGVFLLSRMTVETSFASAIRNIVVFGFGAGMTMPIHTIAVQNTVPYSLLGAATAIVAWLRGVGSLFGLAIVGLILNNRFASEFIGNLAPEIREMVPPEKLASIVDNPQALVNIEARTQLQGIFEGLGTQGTAFFEQMLSTLQSALSSALIEVFAVFSGVAILALIVNLFLKGVPSYKRRQDEPTTEPEDSPEVQ